MQEVGDWPQEQKTRGRICPTLRRVGILAQDKKEARQGGILPQGAGCLGMEEPNDLHIKTIGLEIDPIMRSRPSHQGPFAEVEYCLK